MLRNSLKKGELTFTQIVIAVIAIIVLVVVIMIFSGTISGPSRTLSSCSLNNNGQCLDEFEDCRGIVLPGNFSDCIQPKKCCVNPMRS